MRYNYETLQNGLYIIKKKCLTNDNTQLIKLVDYVDETDTQLEAPIRRMCNNYNIIDYVERFLNVMDKYKCQFCLSDNNIDTRNVGLLVDMEGNAQFAVWGKLKRFTYGLVAEYGSVV